CGRAPGGSGPRPGWERRPRARGSRDAVRGVSWLRHRALRRAGRQRRGRGGGRRRGRDPAAAQARLPLLLDAGRAVIRCAALLAPPQAQRHVSRRLALADRRAVAAVAARDLTVAVRDVPVHLAPVSLRVEVAAEAARAVERVRAPRSVVSPATAAALAGQTPAVLGVGADLGLHLLLALADHQPRSLALARVHALPA